MITRLELAKEGKSEWEALVEFMRQHDDQNPLISYAEGEVESLEKEIKEREKVNYERQ